MMPNINPALVYRLQSLLNPAGKVLIVLPSDPSIDSIAAGLALFLSLTQKGKEVKIASPSKITVSIGSLFAVDKITDQLGQGGKNLVISFPYVEGSIEKVSYNIQNDKFNLVIEPRGEGQVLDKNAVEFSRGGEGSDNFDMVFYVNISSNESLGKLSTIITKLADGKSTVLISPTDSQIQTTIRFGTPSNGSVSEIIALLLSRMGLPFDGDIADNLLKGIKQKTNNFTQNISPDTFEAAAICMRKQQAPQQPSQPRSFSDESNGATMNIPKNNQQQQRQPVSGQTQQAPPDWLKPKIFRSGSNQNSDDQQNPWGGSDKGSLI